MNLTGRIVKYHLSEEDASPMPAHNNYQATCPAIVTADWGDNGDNLTSRCLNVKLILDGSSHQELPADFTDHLTSINHTVSAGFYPPLDPESKHQEEARKIKAGHWEMY